MRKVFFLYLSSLLFSVTGSAQDSLAPPPGGASVFRPSINSFAKMGEIIPPAPDASAIARYGGVNIELNTGSVNKAIELKALSNKSLSVPISLFFKSNGLNVNQFPSRVGMGWAISAGGQISRVIHGQDDLIRVRYVPNFTVVPNDEDPITTNYCWNLVRNGDKDSEPDIFSFSAGGYSGKFLFDNSGIIRQIPASNLKIEYNATGNPPWNFKITAPDGVQYYFGGTNGTESTKYAASSQGGSYNPNAWCLNKILHPNGYFISFIYYDDSEHALIDNYIVGITQTHYKNPSDAAIDLCYGDECINGVLYPIYDAKSYMSAKIRLLKEITTNYGAKVTFEYSTARYPENVITAINYFNENNKRISRYVLHYNVIQTTMGINGQSENIPFIDKITEFDAQNNLLNLGHTFEYYGLNNIPTRVNSYSQDHWGFFNGKNNFTLIAKPEDEELAYNFPYSTADRNPDPLYGVNGLIKKITYPTGGKDEIDYEANTIEELQDQNPYSQVYQTISGTSDINWISSAGLTFNVTYENKVKIWYQCEYVGMAGYDPTHHRGRIRIVDLTTNLDVYDDWANTNAGVTTVFKVLPSGTYRLYVSSRGVDIRTDGNVKFRTGTSPNMQYVSVAVGGLRVKKTTTSDNIVNNPIVKRYYYGTLNNLNYSSASLVSKPRYLVQFDYTVGFLWGVCNALLKTYSPHKALHCNSVNKLYLFDGKIQEYTSVIESVGGDNFENGGIEHKFHVINDIEAQPIRGWYNLDASLTNSYYLSKGEIETNVYAKKSGILVPVSSTQNEITIDSRNFKDIEVINVHQKGPLPCQLYNSSNIIIGPYPLHHLTFNIHRYYLTSAWKYLSKTTEKKFDENGQNPLTQVTDYYYDDDRNLMLSRTETLNSKQELLKQQIKYPHDFTTTGNVYEDMVNKNMVAENVETKVFKNGQELFKSTNNYSNSWYVDKHVVAIDNVEEQKTGYSSETRFRYYSYDTDGNPTELSKESDARQTVIWDYKANYPIAKIINANQSDVAFTSFEADSKGYWTFTGTPVVDYSSPTGKKSYVFNGSNSITKAGLNSSLTYIVSYWTKNSSAYVITGTQSGYPITGRSLSGWIYFEHKVIGQSSVTIGGTGSIDELRLYPDKALMTTYTYEPMIGMTGECDANNKTTYYEYDGFSRLALVRDQDRNILKKICYNYAGMVEDCTSPCSTPEPPNWQNTATPPTCQQGTCGNTGYQLQEQRDINPCSLTFDQTQIVPVYNPTACPLPNCVNLTSTNITGFIGYTASYNDGMNIYSFPVPTATGLQPLGTIPAGNYTLTISRTTGAPMYGTFKSGCFKQVVTGSMAIFSNVGVSTVTCNSITLDISGIE